jgi:hypothetical protein
MFNFGIYHVQLCRYFGGKSFWKVYHEAPGMGMGVVIAPVGR